MPLDTAHLFCYIGRTIRRLAQVVRGRSAKPLCSSSILLDAFRRKAGRPARRFGFSFATRAARHLAAAFILVFALAFPLSAQDVDFWSDVPNEELAEILIDGMTDEDLLAQIFMFGWAGDEPSSLLNTWVNERGLGSVKIFGWNTDDTHNVARSVASLQSLAAARPLRIPLFVATDQEGGWIRHVKGTTSETPGNLAIGASGYPRDAYYAAYYINREMHALGINMNFAPSVDIYSNLGSSVIGPRSFGSNPEAVGILGDAFAAGSLAAGVLPTAKHFPGHGDTSEDSHGSLPRIDIDRQTFETRELVPFEYLIRGNIPAIMSAHIAFPAIEPDGRPASLSRLLLTDILRGRMGFKGLIITDDIMMNGATMYAGSVSRAVTMAIEAGNDIIISSTTPDLDENMWTVNLARMADDETFRERVKEAARLVIRTKLDYFKGGAAAPLYPDETTLDDCVPDREGRAFFLSLACRAVTLLKRGASFPLAVGAGGRVLLAGPFEEFFDAGLARYPGAELFRTAYSLEDDRSNYDAWNATGLAQRAAMCDTVIICVYDAHSANVARRLQSSGKRVIVLSLLSPVYAMEGFEWADTVLCGYSYSGYSFKALFAALRGDFAPVGTLPIGQ